MKINNIIVGQSYDDSGPLDFVVKDIEEKAHEERAQSGITNHYLKRSRQDPRSLKYNYLIHGIPISAYAMMNVYKTDTRSTFVGDDTVGLILHHFKEFFGVDSEQMVFSHEGDEWSLANTLAKGKDTLGFDEDELIYFLAGDLIHGYDIMPRLTDSDNKNHDIVIDLNCRELIYDMLFDDNTCHYNRRWHLPIRQDFGFSETHWLKECNDAKLKLSSKLQRIANLMFAGRKSYDDNCAGDSQGGRSHTIKELYKERSKQIELMLTAPVGVTYMALRKYTSLNPGIASCYDLERFLEIGLGLNVKVKAEHNDWGFLADIDSAEDLVFMETLSRSLDDPSQIHPYFNELSEFGSYLAKQDIPWLSEYHNYMNQWFEQFSLLRDNKMYNDKGDFLFPKVFADTEDKINTVIDNRKRYLKDNYNP